MNDHLQTEEPVSNSKSGDNQGTDDPKAVLPISNTQYPEDQRNVGILFYGNGYGSNSAYITCTPDDLMKIKE